MAPSRARAEFLINLNFDASVTAQQQTYFQNAAIGWQRQITGYKEGVTLTGVTINVSISDLPGSTLGNARPTAFATQQGTVYATAGEMNFDTAAVAGDGFGNVVLHEMGHVLGLGTLWDQNGLYVPGTFKYTGANALAGWKSEFGQTFATFVPVEQSGGEGTADGHWDEVDQGAGSTGIISNVTRQDFADELMTGWGGSGTEFISSVTLGSLKDLGYQLGMPQDADGNYLIEKGTYFATMTGARSMRKITDGVATLNAASTYTEGSTLEGGVLNIGNAYALGTGPVRIINGAQLSVGEVNLQGIGKLSVESGSVTGATGSVTASSYEVWSGTIGATLAGSGSLTKLTAGSVTLSAANTFTGGTTIYAGTLVAGHAAALSTGTVTIQGGTLEAAAFADTPAAKITLVSGAITGSGSVAAKDIVLESGTVSASLAAGPSVVVQSAHLVDVAGGRLAVGAGATLSGMTQVLVRDDGVALAAQDLALGGSVLRVSTAGVLSVGRDLTVATAELRDDRSVLSVGRNLTATGSVTVYGGELRVGGDIITPRFAVAGGRYSPAGVGSVGTARVTGAFAVSAGGTLVVDVLDSTHSDVVTPSAGATLTGGAVLVNMLPGGVVRVGDSIDFIAGGAAVGSLASVRTTGSGNPFVGFSQHPTQSGRLVAFLDYDAVSTRVDGSANVRAAADSIAAVVAGGTPYRADLDAMAQSVSTNAEAVAALSLFVPDNGILLPGVAKGQATTLASGYNSHVSRLRTGDFTGSDFWSNPLFESYSFNYSGKPKLVASMDSLPLFDDNAATDFHIWINGTAGARGSKQNAGANRTKSDENYLNATLGADCRLTTRRDNDVHAGVFVGMQGSDSDVGTGVSRSTTEARSVAPGVYITADLGEAEVDLMAAYATSDYKLKRSVPAMGGTPASTAVADTSGEQWMVRGGISHVFRFKDTLFFSPNASLAYVDGSVDGYRETGGGLAGLTVGKQAYESLESNLGLNFGRRINLAEVSIFPVVSLGWGHEFLDSPGSAAVSSNTLGQAFRYTANTPEVGADFMTFGVSAALFTSENSRLTLAYNGRYFRQGVETDHSVSATLRLDF